MPRRRCGTLTHASAVMTAHRPRSFAMMRSNDDINLVHNIQYYIIFIIQDCLWLDCTFGQFLVIYDFIH